MLNWCLTFTGQLKKAAGEHPAVQPWWVEFLNGFAIPNVEVFNILVPWGEFLVGIGLILGVFTTFATLMGLVYEFRLYVLWNYKYESPNGSR
jgi:thiosulfate dehydrogenase [quinone] large subunit